MWAFAAELSSVLIRLIALLGAENFKFLNVLTLDFRSSVDGVPSVQARLESERRR
jgi:hypothetical protein